MRKKSNKIQYSVIQIRPDADTLELRAANELKRYIRLLFGHTVPIVFEDRPQTIVFRVGIAQWIGMPNFDRDRDPEAYAVRSFHRNGVPGVDLVGSTPVAVLWAVYELVHGWGVTFLTTGDVLPEPASGIEFIPSQDISRRPSFSTRCFRIVNDIVSSGILWSLRDYEALFDQLIKMRFNTVYAMTYPHQPWCHWSYRGVERTRAELIYGFRHLVHERTVGKELFGRLGLYTNPDFAGAETYDAMIHAGRRFMHGLIRAAHERGLKFILGHVLNDLPDEFKRRMPAWSKRIRIPRSVMPQTHVHAIGMCEDGGNYRFGHLMTPLNPVYVEMTEQWLLAHLNEYPEVDGLFLTQSEFPPSAGGIERCWRELDQRHGLSPKFTYSKLMRQANQVHMVASPGRAVREAQGAIATVRLLDLVLNERQNVGPALGKDIKVYHSFMSETLMPILPHVFDAKSVEFVGLVDYMPSAVAERMNCFSFARESGFKTHLITTINDDNVGFLPQFNLRAMDKTVRAMRRWGVNGYWFRQFDISAYEMTMGYLAQSGWESTASLQHWKNEHIERICGRGSVAPVQRSMRLLENIAQEVDAVVPTGFVMPSLISTFWKQDAPNFKEQHRRLAGQFAKAEGHLVEAAECSESRGRCYVESLLAFVRASRLFLEGVMLVRKAREELDKADQLKATASKSRGFALQQYNSHVRESAKLLRNATEFVEDSIKVRASSVQDPSDLGTVLGMNVYGLDWLRGKADEVRLSSELWGLSIE